ncbi:MAG: class I SAM-dependent methyltransferase [Xanthomonadales bacterium]|nr:class I SAM-dependent methyltransferase [Xanthomonadales bacterium]MDL1869496.1 class I SAM-dependent methyltransferase [Gammaproteobacteria bacterium PRO6]
MPKRYDRAYFDKWYRSPAHRVGSRAQLMRKVAMVVHLAEHYLARPLRNVLDVGCGEAPWRAPLLRLRPQLAYRGLDASPYVVQRYGRSRNIGLASFGQLGELRFDTRFDLIVCSDMLHYVPAAELRRGLAGFGELLEGLAFIEVFTSVDRVAGDLAGFIARPPAWYRARFLDAGLLACGSHAYLGPRLLKSVAALECC